MQKTDHRLEVYAGVRDVQSDQIKLGIYKTKFTRFDFFYPESYAAALDHCDVLFLLRPPQISDVEKYFNPIIETCKAKGVKHIVFISVQGADKNTIIPHHKIEKLIAESGIPYTFLRPAYFMQNFTTTLSNELVKNQRIYLPVGNAKFTLIDVGDIGSVSASILTNISQHINKSYDLTSKEKLTFSEMAVILSEKLEVNIQFKSPNLITYFLAKRREKTPVMLILVLIMLHYSPRFKKEPETTDWVENITGKPATTFEGFVGENKKRLRGARVLPDLE